MRFTVYRVRFQLVNDGDEAITLDPALQLAGDGWSLVPEVDPKIGSAFYAASDDGRRFRERRTWIPVARLRLAAAGDAAPVQGLSSAGENPLTGVSLPAHSFTEIEFAIRATMDATWAEGYELRLVSDGTELTGATRVAITMGEKPDVELSPGQKNGRGVKDPVPLYALDPTIGWTDLPTTTATVTGHTASYALRGPIAAAGPYTTPHTNYTLTTDTCASCHATHAAQGAMLLREPAPQSTLCFTCHDGTGAVADVQGDWTSPSIPANDAGDRIVVLAPGNHDVQSLARPRRVRRRPEPAQRVRRLPPAAPHGRLETDRDGRRLVVVRCHRRVERRVGHQRRRRDGPSLRAREDHDLRVRAVLQVPLRVHAAPGPGCRPPQPLGPGQGAWSSTRPTCRTTRSRRRARTRRARWHAACRARRRTSCGTSTRPRRCAA